MLHILQSSTSIVHLLPRNIDIAYYRMIYLYPIQEEYTKQYEWKRKVCYYQSFGIGSQNLFWGESEKMWPTPDSLIKKKAKDNFFKLKKKQCDRDDALEITVFWTWLRENQVSQLFSIFKREIISGFFFKTSLRRISSRIFYKRDKNQAKYVSSSISLKFVIFTHHYKINIKCYNKMYKSSPTIHYLIISFKIVISRNQNMFSTKYFVCTFNSTFII